MKIIMEIIITIFVLLVLTSKICSQEVETEEFSGAVEDNSFFIEEAYNQEESVVQHIFNANYFSKPGKDLSLSFTQEWPLFSKQHQISYSIPYSSLNSNLVKGFGDVLINYRYQLLDRSDFAAIAPRFSIILPTGNYDKGLGNNVVGFQFNFPLSKRLANDFITHFNAGLTYSPGVKGSDINGNDITRDLLAYNIGGSLIWLVAANFNFFLEYLINYNSDIDAYGDIVNTTETIINPGIRFSINLEKLQIVPGLAIPISSTTDLTKAGVFFYLSFEHPF